MTIDLGNLTTVGSLPAPEMPLRHYPSSRRRLAQSVALVIVLLATSVSSVRAFGTPPRPVASLPIGVDARLLVTGEHALVMDTVGTSSRIISYALPGGRREWTAPLPGSANDAQAFVLGSVIVAVTPAPSRNTTFVAAFDLHTGRMAWYGSVDIAFAAGRIILEYVATDPPDEQLRAVDPATGGTTWSVDLPPGCVNQLDSADTAKVTALLETCPGAIQRVDLATGAITARATFDIPESNDYSLPGPASITFIGDVALVTQDSADRTWISAFRASDLTPLWAQTPLAALATLQSCGPDLCIVSVDGRLDLVDPDTGRVRRPGTGGADRPIPYTVGIPVPPGTTMLIAPDPAPRGVDVASTPRVNIAVSAPAGSTVRLATGGGHGTTWIGQIIRTGGTVTTRLLWDLHDFGGGCVVAGPYIACTGSSRQVELRRLPG